MNNEFRTHWIEALLVVYPDLLFVMDRDGHCLFANQTAREQLLTGEASGDSALDLGFLEADARAVRETIERTWTSRAEQILKVVQVTRRGQRDVAYRFLPTRNVAGAVDAVLMTGRDITACTQQCLATQFERQSAEMQAVLDSIADGLVVFDPQGQVLRSKATADMLPPYPSSTPELSPEERGSVQRITWPDGSPIAPDDTPASRALRGEAVKGELMRLDRPDGGRTWLSVSAAPIQVRSGERIGAVSTFVDVTGTLEVRERLQDINRMLSHDLKTPLGTILMQTGMIASASGIPKPVLRRVQAILKSARRMNAMIQDLDEIAHLETGSLKLSVRPVELQNFTQELLQRLSGTLQVERIQLQMAEGIPPIQADPDRLERILVNLLSNALKYSPPDREVVVRADVQDASVVLSVRDFGEGIASEDLPHIFERYYRSTRAKTGRAEGLGLGLYITRLLVEAHQAHIKAESEIGKGSAFQVVFPAVASRLSD